MASRSTSLPVRARGLTLRSLAALALAWCLTSSASADATVVVELKRQDGSPVAATVQLSKGQVQVGCETDAAGRCTLKNVAAGIYQVTVMQAGKPAAKKTTAMIPPSGEVKLIVNAD